MMRRPMASMRVSGGHGIPLVFARGPHRRPRPSGEMAPGQLAAQVLASLAMMSDELLEQVAPAFREFAVSMRQMADQVIVAFGRIADPDWATHEIDDYEAEARAATRRFIVQQYVNAIYRHRRFCEQYALQRVIRRAIATGTEQLLTKPHGAGDDEWRSVKDVVPGSLRMNREGEHDAGRS